MNTRAKNRFTRPLALALAVTMAIAPSAYTPVATAQSYGSTQEQSAYTQQELDQMMAPIALYPDSLLSQVLMASTYPLEVVQAARWSRANPHLKGDDAVRAVESQDWDPSVKSLVAFPQILEMMDQKLDWTERLGEAFLDQQPQVMDTVQQLRQRAYAAGNLRSDDRIRVTPQERVIVVEPAQPQVVYVPYYNPVVVYGSWWWPHHPPVYWSPWPGYHARPGLSANFFWGSGISLSAGFFFGGFDWHRRHARIVHVHNHYYDRHHDVARVRTVNAAPGQWRHDPDHRRGVPYRAASLRRQFGRTDASPDGRRDSRGRDSTTINSNSNDRRDARVSAPRIENRTDARRDTRERNDNRPDVRDARSPATPPAATANTRPDVRDARVSAPRVQSNTETRSDARERNDSRRDAPDARISVPRVENNTNTQADTRERNDNGPDRRDARDFGFRHDNNANTRPDAIRQNDNRPDVRGTPANRPDARMAPRPEPRVGVGSRAEIRDSRPNIENRSAAVERASSAAAEVQSAVIRNNPGPQAAPDQRNRREARRSEETSSAQASGQNSGSRSSTRFHDVGKREQQKK